MNRIILAILLVPLLLATGTGCAGLPARTGDDAAAAKAADAQNLLRDSKYAAAIAELRKIIQEHPNSAWAAKAKYSIALASVSPGNPRKDYAAALAEFDEFLAQYPQDERVPEARSWRQALKTIIDARRENERLNKSIEQLKQLDVRQEQKRQAK